MEIKIENQFCVKRFKPGHSRVARCHKPISILCQERFKPGHSRVARCHKPISILCQDFQSKFLNKIIQIIYQVLGMNYYAHAGQPVQSLLNCCTPWGLIAPAALFPSSVKVH